MRGGARLGRRPAVRSSWCSSPGRGTATSGSRPPRRSGRRCCRTPSTPRPGTARRRPREEPDRDGLAVLLAVVGRVAGASLAVDRPDEPALLTLVLAEGAGVAVAPLGLVGLRGWTRSTRRSSPTTRSSRRSSANLPRVAFLPSSDCTNGWVWIRPSPWEWMPAFRLPGGLPDRRLEGGRVRDPLAADVHPEVGVPVVARLAGARGWRRAAGPCPRCCCPRRVSTMATTPTITTAAIATFQPIEPLPAPLRLAVPGAHRRAVRAGAGLRHGVRRLPADLRAAGPRAERAGHHLDTGPDGQEHRRRDEQQPASHPATACRRSGRRSGGAARSCGTGGARGSRPARERRCRRGRRRRANRGAAAASTGRRPP